MERITIIKKIFLGAMAALFLLVGGYSVYAYPEIFKVEVTFGKVQDIGFREPITVNFSEPVLPSSVENALSIYPNKDISCAWSEGNKRMEITPKDYWQPDTEYDFAIAGAKSVMLTRVDMQFSFTTQPYPSVASFYPANGEKDVDVDIEDPIVVTFDRSLEDFSVKFVVNPRGGELAHEQDGEKKRIKLMPKTELEKGKRYSISIYIKQRQQSDEDYRRIYDTYFETKNPLPPSQWDMDPTIKLSQAKTYTVAKIKTGKLIDINLSQQVMVIFENGMALDAYLVSSGKRGMETPIGDYQIRNKAAKPWSKKYALFMPNWMAVVPSGEFGIHELPEWPGGYKEGANHLGTPVSHGCVRLGVGAAKRVFDWAEIGTPVVIHQ